MNYFEQRERAILKDKFDEYYKHSGYPVRGLTVNTRKASIKKLLNAGICGTPSLFCENSIVLTDDTFKAGTHPYHHAGAYYVQEPSAASAAALLNIEEGDFVLDMCAAPGGKTAQLGAALNGTGLLVANEIVPARASVLKSNLQRMGFENCVITNADTARLADGYGGIFNKILVDAPCSGEGMFYKEPQAVLQHSEKLVLSCAALGEQILDNAASLLCKGGTIVYSTCTFSPQENEMQIGSFLARHSEFSLVETGATFGSEGESVRCKEYAFNSQYTRRIYPCHGGEGHFIAKLHKNGSTLKATLEPKADKQDAYLNAFLSEYFPVLKNSMHYKAKESLFLLPKHALANARGVNIISQGVYAGSVVKNRFVPEHAFFMAFGTLCENKETLTLCDSRCNAFLRGEEIEALTAQNGYCSVICDDMVIGFGKVSLGRLKNHYPKGLRNLK